MTTMTTPLPKLGKEDIIKQRVERFAQVFTRVNSTLTLRPIRVRTEWSMREAPAWSTADEVTFNARLIGELNDPKSVTMLRGLNLHEDAHILYTPRTGSAIWQWVEETRHFQAFNALEDQRIETLLVGRYPSVTPWLTATMAKFLIETDQFDGAFPLLRGRRYLPVEIRRAARLQYKRPEIVDDLSRVIDEYRTIIFPRDTERAKELIEEFWVLMMSDDANDDLPNPNGHGDRPVEGMPSSTSRPATEKEQERDRDRADSMSEEDDDDDDAESGSSPKGEDEDDEDDDEQDASGPQAGNDGLPQIRDMLNDILHDVIEENEQVIDDLIRQISGLPRLSAADHSTKPEALEWSARAPLSETVQASRAFGRELERIRTTHDPSWARRVDAGRLVPLRAAREDDPDTVYDMFKSGREDVTDIECVIALDISGSMDGQALTEAYQAMYALKRALDRVNADTTVLTFGSYSNVLYDRDEKADMSVRYAGTGGGTCPDHAIRYATRVFAESNRAVRIFIVITDGSWYNADTADDLILRMRQSGVVTSLAYITQYGGTLESRHNCESAVTVKNVFNIVKIAQDIIRIGIARQLMH